MKHRNAVRRRAAFARYGGARFWLLPALFFGLAAALVVGVHLRRHDSPSGSPREAATANLGKGTWRRPGPWGRLESHEMRIEPPDSYFLNACSPAPPTWRFPGSSRSSLLALFAPPAVPPKVLLALEDRIACDAGGCTVTPSLELLAGLDSTARAGVYGALLDAPGSGLTIQIFRRRADEPSRWDAPELSQAARALFQKLSFRRGDTVYLADVPLLCRELNTVEERTAALRVLLRSSALLVSLHVSEHEDVEPLVRYWGSYPGAREVRPLLESLARTPGGGATDVAWLLPPLSRSLLYTFPSPDDPPRNCHWTSFNFFATTPDDRLTDGRLDSEVLAAQYHAAQLTDPHLGDLLLFSDPDGTSPHSAIYVADDLLFTKNGQSPLSPWILTSLERVKMEYPLSTVTARRRNDVP